MLLSHFFGYICITGLFPDIVKSASRQLIRNAILIVSVCLIFSAMFLGHLFYYNFSNYDFGDIACYLSSFYKLIYSFPGTNIVWGNLFLLCIRVYQYSVARFSALSSSHYPSYFKCIPVLQHGYCLENDYNTVEDSLSANCWHSL